jgi:hypothetical protein
LRRQENLRLRLQGDRKLFKNVEGYRIVPSLKVPYIAAIDPCLQGKPFL